MNVHFIAIGGSAMHNLALAMHHKGYQVTGSDDEIAEPSKSRLAAFNLLPEKMGWFTEKITKNIDAVILGMHARADNPELLAAQAHGIKIFSYPEYIYDQSKNKTRIVIGGSHGKTTITAMILHVFNFYNQEVDYMVGAQLKGFDTMVKLTENNPLIVIEGDEYLSSPIDRRPKFHLYKPHIALLSGIAWDHINVFPTFENYVWQFEEFVNLIEPNGSLVYCVEDEELVKLVAKITRKDIKILPYHLPKYTIENGHTIIEIGQKQIGIEVFGKHNLMNLEGAKLICGLNGIDELSFYEAIANFEGASKRLELVKKNNSSAFYKDFAHSPSKLKATTAALKEQYKNRKLVACMELHTFSSLNEDFLNHYAGTMQMADEAIVYFNPKTITHKKLKAISESQVQKAFGGDNITVFTDTDLLIKYLKNQNWYNKNLLMMSSGTFDGVDFIKLANDIYQV
jgi:UDP-N-acetylmuramate: L-alanyl-gamma-D-glutamyl-meso-diaminopimelate ligase